MTSTTIFSGTVLAILFAWLLAVPTIADAAASPNAFLGGGNALSRAISGESQGLTHASSSSSILERLTFASTKGGRPAETPPSQQQDDDTSAASLPDNASENAVENSNGGSHGANGGNGGNAADGGLVRAGSVVSNSTAINVLNANIIRINTR